MTVTTEVSEYDFSGDGSAVNFPVPFPILLKSHLVVTLALQNASAVAQVLGVNYTIDAEPSAAPTVTMLVAPADGSTLHVERTLPITQGVNLLSAGPFSPATHTEMHDRRTMVEQMLYRMMADLLVTAGIGPAGADGEPPGAFGKFGLYTDNSRIWGVQTQVSRGSSQMSTWGMVEAPAVAGFFGVIPTVLLPRNYIGDGANLLLNSVAGTRQTNVGVATWIQRPRMKTLILASNLGNNTLANRRIVVGLTSSDVVCDVAADATLRYVTVRYDSTVGPNWYVSTADGAGASALDTGIPVVIGTDYSIDINFEDAALLVVTINGTAIGKANFLPSGLGQLKWLATITRLLDDSLSCDLHWHHTMISRL